MSLGPVRGSTTGRPIMVLFDILGQRWSLRILWELRQGPLTFRALRDACDGASPTVLNTRLKALRHLGLVDLGPDGSVLETLLEYGTKHLDPRRLMFMYVYTYFVSVPPCSLTSIPIAFRVALWVQPGMCATLLA